jgi:hypothetical protein
MDGSSSLRTMAHCLRAIEDGTLGASFAENDGALAVMHAGPDSC